LELIMNIDSQEPQDHSELLRRALLAIERLQDKVAKAEASQHEAIAIVGAGCRFPGGANDRERLWNLLIDGFDAVTEVPLDRWDVSKIFDPNPDATGKTYTKWGAFLDDIDLFDAPFFGITPREAVNLDPQQRLLLEIVWEALEDANIPPASIANSRTGVYIGMSGADYTQILMRNGAHGADAYALSGTAHSIAGGRISYFLGAQGPNITVDTACSSSMVAIHLAVKGLRAREADLALAGGVNLTLIADPSVLTSRARMMSPTGRCRTFDASADGYVRAEGCGIIALKRLSDALRDKDSILALIRGSAINQDGRSSGLTAPHGPSQEVVVRAALADAQIDPDDVVFVEAHGTGTALGDPIEVNALSSVFGDRPADRPLLIGSIKANLGHTESAAGVAGLIKAVEALRHRALPKQIHMLSPNPMISWDSWPVYVPLETLPLLPAEGKPLYCGISSFGFSGTNAHIVLEEAPALSRRSEPVRPANTPTLLVLSARSSKALKDLAGRYVNLLASDGAPSLHEIAARVPMARAHFSERVGVVAADAKEAVAALEGFIEGASTANLVSGRTLSGTTPEVVFLFTGQGSQYAGMGSGLYESEPVFRKALDECDRLGRPYMDVSLLEVVLGARSDLIDQTTYTQPALFAIEYALAQMWRAWGVEPTAVMGHSVGEYTAACVAGMLGLEDAIRLVAHRGRLMGALPAGGAMAAVFASEAVVRASIAATGGALDIAAVNGPRNIVISGAVEAVTAAVERLSRDNLEVQRLNVSHAFHSARMDPALDEYEKTIATVRFSAPTITLISNITGAPLGEEGMKSDYWRRHLRETVRFSDSIANLQRDGYRLFLEVGPAPILSGMAQQCGPELGAVYISSLRRGHDNRRTMLDAAARLYIAGVRLSWPAIAGPSNGHPTLPTYPFQRTRFWQDNRSAESHVSFEGQATDHPLLGVRIRSPLGIYATEIGISLQSWAKDHRIFDHTPFPAAGFLELALAAAIREHGHDVCLQGVTIGEALLLPEEGMVALQIVVTNGEGGKKIVQVFSAMPGDAGTPLDWRLHVTSNIVHPDQTSLPPLSFDRNGFEPVQVNDYYERLTSAGAHYGPSLRGIQKMFRNGNTIIAEIALPPEVMASGYLVHPALLDACFQAMGAGMESENDESSTDLYMPIGMKRYRVLARDLKAVTCRVTVAPFEKGADAAEADISLFDADGNLIAEVVGFETRRITPAALQRLLRKTGQKPDWRFKVVWLPSERIEGNTRIAGQNWLVLADANGAGDVLAARLRSAGARVEVISFPIAKIDESDVISVIAMGAPIDRALHGVAVLWPLDAPFEAIGLLEIEAALAKYITATLYALRAVVDRAGRVIVATRGTQSVAMEPANVVQAPIWSFAGVVASEYPMCGLTRIDIDPLSGADDGEALFAEACASDGEDRVAYRGGQRFLARLAPDSDTPGVHGHSVRLEITKRGSLGNLALEPMERHSPGPGEVEIRVYATGLNFRDVLNALGMYQGEAGPLGNECAGVVTAIAPGVTRLAVGDDVVAMIDRSFATHVIAPEVMTVRKPPYITHQEAATVPVAFLTAHYALRVLSGIKRGDRVLIHAVTGGVGMAATQIALRAGAIVFGTAGSEVKRELAKRLGVHYVSDSRSLDFVEDFLRETKGKGVDIVLNSLAGKFIPASLGLVAQGGSFVEIGKTDIWTPETVAQKYPAVRYHPLYLGEIAAAEPTRIQSMLESILADMEGGQLRPLPQRVFSLREAERAFRYMGQGFHTGKVVVTQARPAAIRDDGAYIVTGGLTGLGLTTAKWLADQGARNLVLFGRRAPDTNALTAIAHIEAAGTSVRVTQADVGDRAALAELLEDVRENMGPIRGIVHAAGVLEDGMLSEQTPERFARVMAPKVRGGWLLHELTATDRLDLFVLFSSAAALLGSPGQSNYAAANGFLDGLASYRHARGLPALSINWGSWAEVGMAAGVSADHHRRWAAMGLGLITPETGMDMLGQLLASGAGPQAAALPIVRSQVPATVAPFYRDLIKSETKPTEATPAVPENILADLRAAEPGARRELIEALLVDQVRRVLALPISQIVDPHEMLLNLGMDSLMAMELRNRMQASVGVHVAVADLLGGISLVELGRIVMSQLAFDDEPVATVDSVEWEEGQL
jgi:acyl transferase domain-containing protein/NADPH:quinone reductase-like Zn-dependent oxidoreductase/NAD(P)-dependent dehydrogenase (short-subunit alcohol dehydrogenase family)/aryl carrier-like protein